MQPSSDSVIQNWLTLVVGGDNFGNGKTQSWQVVRTKSHGRGICAVRDIATDELIFSEKPLLHGPCVTKTNRFVCVACYRPVTAANVCAEQCGLPICGPACPRAAFHKLECAMLVSWQPKCGHQPSLSVLKVLTAIRSLLLEDSVTKLLFSLQANRVAENEKCIDVAMQNFHNPPASDIVEKLRHVTATLKTNAFQVVRDHCDDDANGKGVSTKGLYALQSQLNHDCVPNTRHSVEASDYTTSSVYAVRPICKGTELTTTYTNLLWCTPTRRAHLMLTKQFDCRCARCTDATESGTYLAALKCFTKSCSGGILLPTDPLASSCPWQCNQCNELIDFTKICNIQEVISAMVCTKLRTLPTAAVMAETQDADGMLIRRLGTSNQFLIEMKLQIIWKLDVCEAADVAVKEKFCIEICKLLQLLGAGECTLKKLIDLELQKCREAKRLQTFEFNTPTL